jgi:hypothetical protein
MDGREKYKKYRDSLNNNLVRFASNRVSKQKHAAKKRGIDWDLDDKTIINKIVRSKTCALSGRKLIFKIGHPDSPSIDRKNSDLHYSSRNTQIVTTAINIGKNDQTKKEFIKMCCDVARMNGWIDPNEPLIKD